MASFAHEALFYRDEREYLAGAVPFVDRALARGEPVLVAVPGPRIDLLAAALGPRSVQVRFIDMTRAGRNPAKIIPWVLHSFLVEHPGAAARIIGEPVWPGRSPEEYPACVQHEALVNVAFAEHGATILCPYDTAALPREVLDDATLTHPVLVEPDDRRPNVAYTDPDEVVAAFNEPFPDPGPGTPEFAFDASMLPLVREFVAVHAGRAGLGRHRTGDLQLVANELATNAVTHGGGLGWVRMWHTESRTVCEVRDQGKALDRLAGRLVPPPESLGGRGLVLVNYVTDLLRIHTAPEGTAVRAYVDR